VWSHLKSKFLKLCFDKDKYLCLNLGRKKARKFFRSHRLVAIHYISNPYDLPEVNHKDGKKANYRKDNLEWCTHDENEYHAITHGLKPKKSSKFFGVRFNKGWKNKPWRVDLRIDKKRKTIGSYRTELEAAQAYNNYVLKHNLNRPLNEI
jgi:hypothetical protein